MTGSTIVVALARSSLALPSLALPSLALPSLALPSIAIGEDSSGGGGYEFRHSQHSTEAQRAEIAQGLLRWNDPELVLTAAHPKLPFYQVDQMGPIYLFRDSLNIAVE